VKEVINKKDWRQGLIADRERAASGSTGDINLQDYPALLLMYGAGIAAVAAKRYGNLAAILIRTTREHRTLEREEPLAHLLTAEVVVSPEAAQKCINPKEKNYTPVSDYLALVLREAFRDIIPRDAMFGNCFDRFEYIWTLVRIDLRTHLNSSSRWVTGRYLWRDEKHYNFKQTELERLYAEMDSEREKWPGLVSVSSGVP
jgi:hypothetical protein